MTLAITAATKRPTVKKIVLSEIAKRGSEDLDRTSRRIESRLFGIGAGAATGTLWKPPRRASQEEDALSRIAVSAMLAGERTCKSPGKQTAAYWMASHSRRVSLQR